MPFTQAETAHIAAIRPSTLVTLDEAARKHAATIEQRLVHLIRRGSKNLRSPIENDKALLLAELGSSAGVKEKVDAWLKAVLDARAAEQARETALAAERHEKTKRGVPGRRGASFKPRK